MKTTDRKHSQAAESSTRGTPSHRPRVCIVSFEFIGPFRNGGIGTAYTTLGESLALGGLDVTFLYVRPQTEIEYHRNIGSWIEKYAEKGITFVPLPACSDHLSPMWSERWFINKSNDILQWLLAQEHFTTIHFPEHLGLGYSTLLAKREDALLADSDLCVGVHGSHQWLRTLHPWLKENPFIEFLERESVALADVLWSPSSYMLGWMRAQEWRLPQRQMVRPYVLPHSARSFQPVGATSPARMGEIVFFGRLETRKGLELFCDALDNLAANYDEPLTITFLGRHAEVAGMRSEEYLEIRGKNWPWPSRILANFDQPEAIHHLRQPGRFAVIASPGDNSPNTVYECLGAAIPFIATDVGGIPELLDRADVERVCFPYRVDCLADKLLAALRQGISPARPAIDFVLNERQWVSWHERMRDQPGCAWLDQP